jgi:hypothetical protein
MKGKKYGLEIRYNWRYKKPSTSYPSEIPISPFLLCW